MRSEALWNYINDVYRKCKLKKIVNKQKNIPFISFFDILLLCLLLFTDGQVNYRIEAHWLDESSNQTSILNSSREIDFSIIILLCFL